jgi:5-methylcytosine-specific restriction endonuclease McrA
MIDMDQYRKRVAKLYADERTRWRRVLEKGVPKNVKLDLRPDQVLPFTQAEFGKWLWTQIQLNATPCPYCRAPIDILSMELDHKTPFRRRGGPELSNKHCICRKCNGSKGDFTHEEYLLIVAFMEGPGAHFRQRLEGVLRNGGLGNMMRNFPRKGKDGKKPQHTQEALYFDELGAF